MADFKVHIRGMDELRRSFRQYPRIAEPILQRAVNATGAVFMKNTLKDDPVPYRQGGLISSFRLQTARLLARWFPTASYASYVEYGTGIYGPKGVPIVPTTKKALYWRGAEHPVRSVRGMRARPYMERIRDKSAPEINQLILKALDLINKQVATEVNNAS